LTANAFAVGEQAPARSVVTVPFPGAGGLSVRIARDAGSVSWRAFHDGKRAGVRALDVAVVSALTHPLARGAQGAPDGSRLIVDPGPDWSPGPAAAIGASRRLVTDGSTNEVSLIDIGGIAHVHKRYRHSRNDRDTEATALRMLHGAAVAPPLLASYRYRDTDGTDWPLGLLYRFVPGRGLDVPLREDLRIVLAASGRVRPGVSAATGALLAGTGALVRELHARLADAVRAGGKLPAQADAPTLDIARTTDAAATQVAEILPTLGALLPDADALISAATDGLHAELRALQAHRHATAPAAPCHGDLHLGQVVVSGYPPATLRLIDLSPVTLRINSPGYRQQSPWQDVVSLHRALEYFTVAEAHRQVCLDTGIAEDDVATAAHAGPGSGRQLPAEATARLHTAERLAARWRAAALAEFLRGYGAAPTMTREPLYRLLYLRRLLHELRYDAEHARPRYAMFNLCYAAGLPGRAVREQAR